MYSEHAVTEAETVSNVRAGGTGEISGGLGQHDFTTRFYFVIRKLITADLLFTP
jgi:hypothetical protein